MTSEFEFIKRIRQQAAQQSSADLICGIGDDAAIWREQTNRERLITVDLLVEDVDFKLDYTPPAWLGHKTLAVSLSDIAAMGGAPQFSLLTLAIPKINPQSAIRNPQFWEEFFAGYFALAAQHGVTLIGGDISATPASLALDSIVIGQCQTGQAVRRNGARVGDAIYITGALGAAAVGLRLLLEGARVDEAEDSLVQTALRAQLRPEPRVEFGCRLGEAGLAHALIDVSDGLAQDLAHICAESGVGAVIDFDAAPIAEAARGYVGQDAILSHHQAANVDEAFLLAVSGGEDFELLLTAAASDEARLFKLAEECRLPLTRIGEIVAPEQTQYSTPVLLRRNNHLKPLSIRGYDHLAV